MVSYQPPTENLAIFNPVVFLTGDEPLTYNEAVKRFLKYPYAQGTENLLDINVSGVAAFGNQVNITTALTNVTPSLSITDSVSNKTIGMLSNAGGGAYNPLTTNGDALIYSSPNNSSSLTLTTQSSTNTGVRITATSSSLNAGTTTSVPSTQVLCDGTNVVVKPDLKYPDNTIQNSAFTGAGGSAGSYTNTNLTLDSNGKITAIASGSGGAPIIQSYTTPGNFTATVPASATEVEIICIGGGGSGGGGNFYSFSGPECLQGASGGGGGGLSTVKVKINPVSIPTLYVSVGSGGAGAALYFPGSAGGTSSVRKINNTGAFLCQATGGQGGKASINTPSTLTSSVNAGGAGGSGTYAGGNGGYGGFWNGSIVNGASGSKSSAIAPAGGGGGGAIYTPDGGPTFYTSIGGAGGSVGATISPSSNLGGGIAGVVNTDGGLPSVDYINDFIGAPAGGGGGGSNITGSVVPIPISQNVSTYYGAGSGGAGTARYTIFGSTGGTSGAGGSGAVWLIFE